MQSDIKCVVYRLTSPNGKKYIGISSKGALERLKEHDKQARCRPRYLIHKAIALYGMKQFKCEEIFTGTVDECKAEEVCRIASEKTKAPDGYNLTDGGEGCLGMVVSEETRAKLRVAITGKKQSREAIEKRRAANTGKRRSAAFSARMSEVHKGKIVSESTKEKIRSAGKARAANPIERARLQAIGSNRTPEIRARMSAAASARRASVETLRKMSESQKQRHSSIELRRRLSDSGRRAWVTRKANQGELCPL